MRFSICMAAFNAEKTIKTSIQSVLTQSFQDYELIVIDDQSTDSTRKAAESFKDERVKVVLGCHNSLLSTRIQAIEEASGDYILTVDSDDALTPDALEIIDRAISASNADIVHYRGKKVLPDGRTEDLPELLENGTLIRNGSVNKIFDDLVINDNYSTLWNKAIRRSCVNIGQLKKCPGLNIGEDNLILLFTLPSVQSYFYISDCLYRYSAFGGVTRSFSVESYKNHKNRMEGKKRAVANAGIPIEKFSSQMDIFSIKTVAKIIAYFPTRVENTPQAKREFYSCLDEIREDMEFWHLYHISKGEISPVFKVPLCLLKMHFYSLIRFYKNIFAWVRK